MQSLVRQSQRSTSKRNRVAALADEATALERQAIDLRVGLDVLRRQLAAAIRESGRKLTELRALDTPARQRARLIAIAAVLGAALLAITLVLTGGLP